LHLQVCCVKSSEVENCCLKYIKAEMLWSIPNMSVFKVLSFSPKCDHKLVSVILRNYNYYTPYN
jgi:hypothetical protein